MSLKTRVSDDMKTALLGGDRRVGGILRDLKAAFLNEEVSLGVRDTGLSDDQAEQVVAIEVKKRKESIRLYQENGREELAKDEIEEVEVLLQYLPKQLSENEIKTEVEQVCAELNVDSMKDMGRVIGGVKSKLGNSADGAAVARIVKEVLQAKS